MKLYSSVIAGSMTMNMAPSAMSSDTESSTYSEEEIQRSDDLRVDRRSWLAEITRS